MLLVTLNADDCPREHVRLFVSTGDITKSPNVTPEFVYL